MRRSGPVSVVFACAVRLSACAPPTPVEENSQADTTVHHRRYLATGDSAPFGFSPLINPSDPDNFIGYPQDVATDIPFRHLTNTACPGETSGSFLSDTAPDNGCRAFKSLYALHDGRYTTTQIDRDIGYLRRRHRHTDLITVMIGANDLLRLQASCVAMFPNNPVPCIFGGLPGVLTDIRTNLATIYQRFRDAGFQGQLVGVLYYSPDYTDMLTTFGVQALNQSITEVTTSFGGQLANSFDAFLAFGPKPCDAGLLIRLPSGDCDIHPSPDGRILLAGAVEAVVR